MTALFYEALSQYRTRWKSALVSSIGVIISTTALIVLNHLSAMLEQSLVDQLTINGGLSMSVTIIDNNNALSLDDINTALSDIENVKSVHPIGYGELQLDETKLSYIAVDHLDLLVDYTISEGRDLHTNDTLPYVIMTENMQDHLVNNGIFIAVGDTIITDKGVVKLLGIVSDLTLPQNIPQSPNGVLISSLNTYQSLFTTLPNMVIINIESLEVADEVALITKSNLMRLNPDLYIQVNNPSAIIGMSKSITLITSTFAYIAVSICSILGGIGIMNMNIADINQRKSEIALRIAFGATQKCIRKMLIIESCILCIASSIVGSTIGLITVAIIAHYTSLAWLFLPSSLLSSALFAIGVGVFSTLYPANLVQRIPVAYLLKGE